MELEVPDPIDFQSLLGELGEDRLQLALEASGFGDWSWEAATDTVTLSPRAAEILGLAPGPSITWSGVVELIHADDREPARRAAEASLETGGGCEIECRLRRPEDGREIWILVRGKAYVAEGAPIGMLGVVGDVTGMKSAEARLRESEARFRAMADSAPAPAWVTTTEGPVEFVNEAFAEYAGRPKEELVGDFWLSIIHPDDLMAVARRRFEARAALEPYGFEARFRNADGEWKWMKASAKPRFTDGAFQGYVGLAVDITETKRAQREQQLLINELNHRVKNTLTTIQSIARQTLSGVCPPAVVSELSDRLIALSCAHDVLTCRNWTSAAVQDLVDAAIRPYEGRERKRFDVEGPEAWLDPRASLGLSMALHELATNAVKYGALSRDCGRVRLTWTASEAQDHLRLEWRESGGPPVTAPSRKGFGSRLLERGLAGDLGASAQLDFDPAGLRAVITAPLVPPPV